MRQQTKHFINGEWLESTGSETIDVINPATEEVIGTISSGTEEDLNKAVKAARQAFPSFSKSTKEERIHWLENIVEGYEARKEELVNIMTDELGAPLTVSEDVHYQMGIGHFKQAAESLSTYSFEEERGGHTLMKESVGVSGLITPWNFPTNQVSTKIASAIAAGSPVVLKPASKTPFAAMILAEIIAEAGVPKGAFNLVNGSGSVIGNGISKHPDIDFVSFTGSGSVGEKIMQNAAPTIKKVALELGGKSPIVVLGDADVEEAAKTALSNIMTNTGQVCSAGTRVIIPHAMKKEFEDKIVELLPTFPVGDPRKEGIATGPLVSKDQWDTVQSYIEKGEKEATMLVGGTGKPEGLETGYYAKPTIFTDVSNDAVIAQEEIFGPVTTIIAYEDLDEAIDIANDTVYGLAGFVVGKNPETLQYVASNLRAGRITVNNAETDFNGPFGGYKQSGIGREWGDFGIEEYLEIKSVHGMPSS
ncbi:aldehyde dehydrogenase family protein [Salipaludibacillus agaradhaerens]|uniref:Aldehyde dehydrogenase family protein n=1 Tax=Salipaludibacillus agaradhaerens TaxID=76935 RepID=A0A9Q4AYU6_SALAG|nr:aldehyde dehydrogenase family protein [Salipaludibacillus agaradhaerens]MCR6095308.1 aldehyde dehydrogenase family protein [Salipaludibacillus agaradhaerens]MCR6115134.1 aldehyde dehydrogenase family protein [Salipaludibacillus agaradhaerens]